MYNKKINGKSSVNALKTYILLWVICNMPESKIGKN